MKYISTRGNAPELAFDDVLLTGLAADGGLYVPKEVPQYSLEEIESWRDLSYTELAHKVIYPFVEGCVDSDALKGMLEAVYNNDNFGHKAIAPVQQIDHNEYVLELFHGPTLAFKDFALQLLGRLLDYVLEKRQEKVVIMGATSGDTGSAAIEGTKACKNVDIFILHPNGKVSEVQRRQMTTVTGDNIFNIAIEGNFDQAQDMVKASFGDQSFLRGERKLVAVNSINWARIMAQIVYYFYSSLNLGGPLRPMAYSVPTGNFGDIFAGYMAKKMGLPIEQLIIATNENDVLHRLMANNLYKVESLKHTITPSMDIAVSSNFERLLFDLYDRDGLALADLMNKMADRSQPVELSEENLGKARDLFDSYAVDQDTTVATMKEVFAETGYLLDPHTAIGVKAARVCRRNPRIPMITLGTAHPVKFEDAVNRGGFDMPKLPHHLADLMEREERLAILPADLKTVQDFIAKNTFKD
ncbi:threonine synthase [Parathalassolituus penaei]|uniref:Threonine synthase n=1 Tax=Parathalassolituus penaei TaxID=2997323 RepID=A0A9X3EGM7_9GAMM|nr:threonine synthase [Parathalassolituus penaei]MCY0967197.1 threonine synthase [Parathalassolituus penaei]